MFCLTVTYDPVWRWGSLERSVVPRKEERVLVVAVDIFYSLSSGRSGQSDCKGHRGWNKWNPGLLPEVLDLPFPFPLLDGWSYLLLCSQVQVTRSHRSRGLDVPPACYPP